MTVRVLWEPRDLWVGVFWDRRNVGEGGNPVGRRELRIYICLVPCLPILLTFACEEGGRE